MANYNSNPWTPTTVVLAQVSIILRSQHSQKAHCVLECIAQHSSSNMIHRHTINTKANVTLHSAVINTATAHNLKNIHEVRSYKADTRPTSTGC